MPESNDTPESSSSGDSRLLTFLFVLLSANAWLLSWPPVDLWPMSFLWAALLVRAVLGAKGWGWPALCGLVMYSIAWAWLLRWSSAVTGPGYPVLAVYSAAWFVVFMLVLRRLAGRGPLQRLPLAVSVPVIWLAIEYLRAEIFLGAWPWYLAGQCLIEWPLLAQIADLGGVWMVGVLVLTVGASASEWMGPERPRSSARWSAVVAIGGLVFTLGYGVYRLGSPTGPELGRILLVQTDLPQNNKIGWPFAEQLEDVAQFMRLTSTGLADSGPADLVVWPETSIPGPGFDEAMTNALNELDGVTPTLQHWPRDMWRFVRDLDTPVLVGTNTWAGELLVRSDEQGSWLEPMLRHNSATLLSPDGSVMSYHKIFPTPFGERLPWIDAWPWLRRTLLDLGAGGMTLDLDAGPASQPPVLLSEPALELVTPICFEASVPSVTRRLVLEGDGRADLMVNLTNDGWFGSVDGGRLAHAQSARYRTIELRRPLLRCANTGQSVWYDSCGRERGALISRTAGTLLATPNGDSRHTLYAVIGNAFPIAALVFTTLMFACSFSRKYRS